MDLKEFISASLTQIAEGVAQSAPAISALGGAVSPAFTPSGAAGEYLGKTNDASAAPVYAVAFDVAVVVGTTGATEGGGKLQVAGLFSVGGKAGMAEKEETTSRIKFVVPLQLPTDTQSKAASDKIAAERKAEYNRPLAARNSGWTA